MRVRVLRCSEEQYWYNDEIGDIFEVVGEEETKWVVIPNKAPSTWRGYINKRDAEIVQSIEEKVSEMLKWDHPSIYVVDIFRRDINWQWYATAELRGSGRAYTASGETIEKALEELEKILSNLYCPTCGRILEKNSEDNNNG